MVVQIVGLNEFDVDGLLDLTGVYLIPLFHCYCNRMKFHFREENPDSVSADIFGMLKNQVLLYKDEEDQLWYPQFATVNLETEVINVYCFFVEDEEECRQKEISFKFKTYRNDVIEVGITNYGYYRNLQEYLDGMSKVQVYECGSRVFLRKRLMNWMKVVQKRVWTFELV